ACDPRVSIFSVPAILEIHSIARIALHNLPANPNKHSCNNLWENTLNGSGTGTQRGGNQSYSILGQLRPHHPTQRRGPIQLAVGSHKLVNLGGNFGGEGG